MPRAKVAVKKPRKPTLPKLLPDGEILTDSENIEWRIGSKIGEGGGYIYLASNNVKEEVNADAQYVLKVELKYGPLFTERRCYQNTYKEEPLKQFLKLHKLTYLGVPKFISSGRHTIDDEEQSFIVLQRLGEDLDKQLQRTNQKFTPKITFMLAKHVLNTLEYLHSRNYVHADIKASNLMMGYGPKASNQVFLVDYGIAQHYLRDGQHQLYKEDPRNAHKGTLQYTSLDAHKGVDPSRRADIEILGYNILHWLSGSLPWQDTDDLEAVSKKKQKLKSKVIDVHTGSLMEGSDFVGEVEVKKYLRYAYNLSYIDVPDYNHLRQLFEDALTKNGLKDDGKFNFESVVSSLDRTGETKRKATFKRQSEDGNTSNGSPRQKVTPNKAMSSGESSPQKKKPTVGNKRKATSSSSVDSLGEEQMPKAKKSPEVEIRRSQRIQQRQIAESVQKK